MHYIRTFFSLAHTLLLALGVVGTYVMVMSGFDWWYFVYTYEHIPQSVLFVADILGFLIPIFLPLCIYIVGVYKVDTLLKKKSGLLFASILLGFVSSMCIKMFTGRMSPPHHGPFDVDISHLFQFGFMEHHIIGGWPSSHATVMMALAVTLVLLFKYKGIWAFAVYTAALGIGIGVTFGFHWFSEFLMGSLLGIVIGRTVIISLQSKIDV